MTLLLCRCPFLFYINYIRFYIKLKFSQVYKKYIGGKEMLKKVLFTSLCLGVLGLAGCGEAANSEVVRVFVSGDTSEGNAYSQMAEKYEEETGIAVEVTDIPYADLNTKITSAVQADDAPDVARVSGVVPDWSDYLIDLTEIAESSNTLDSMTIRDENDVVKAIPTDITAVGMFINTDLFEEAGVDYPTSEEDIWTWDEFLTAVEDVMNETDARYGFVMDGSDHRLRAFTYQFGGEDFVLNDAGDSFETDDNTIEALELFVELHENEIMPKSVWTSGEDASSMFKSGLIPAYMSGSWQINDFATNITDFNWEAIYMPYEEQRATNMGGNFIVGFENSQNSEGGKAFIEWLYQAENYTQLAEYAGYLPALDGIEISYPQGQEAYDIYNQEIAAAATPISGKQTSDQVTNTMKGFTGLTGAYRDSMVQLLNDEITLDQLIENVVEDYNEGFLE